MTAIAWVVLCVSVMTVGAAVAIWVQAAGMVRRQQAGSEYLVMAFWPVFALAPLAGLAGAIAAFWLASRTGSAAGRGILFAAGGILAAWEALAVIGVAWSL
jgi:hypothetical protein